MLEIEGYDVRKRIRVKQQAFCLQLFFVHSALNLNTVSLKEIADAIDVGTNQAFFLHFILRLN